jgi:hypothetical protein
MAADSLTGDMTASAMKSTQPTQFNFPDIIRHKNGNYCLYSFKAIKCEFCVWCIYR